MLLLYAAEAKVAFKTQTATVADVEDGDTFYLSLIDLAGEVEARRHANKRFVTGAMKEVVFKQVDEAWKPIPVRDSQNDDVDALAGQEVRGAGGAG